MKVKKSDKRFTKHVGCFLRVGCCVLAAMSLPSWGGIEKAKLDSPLTVVAQKPQAIAFKAFPVKVLGDPDFEPVAKASSTLPVSYASSNPEVAVVEDGQIHIVAPGTSVITASQPGDAAYKAAAPVKQILTVNVRLTADVGGDGNGGTVTGAGLYASNAKVTLTAKPAAGNTFLHWEDDSQTATRSLTMPAQNMAVTASFAPTDSIQPPMIEDPGPQQAMVGVPFALSLNIASASQPTVTVTGLPAGLKYDATTKSISGVPTAVGVDKMVTVTAKNVNKTAVTQKFSINTVALPVWAVGTFNGSCMVDNKRGTATMTVTAQGKITGKLVVGSASYAFSATSYGVDSNLDNGFGFSTLAIAGNSVVPLRFSVLNSGQEEAMTLSTATGWLEIEKVKEQDKIEMVEVTMYRNVWKDGTMIAKAAEYAGYYTATLADPSGDCGSGYLAFTVDKTGGVKTAGKLADGTTVSLSGTLLLNENGDVYTIIYLAPTAYNGGCFYGGVNFFFDLAAGPTGSGCMLLSSLDTLTWENRNPQATGKYDVGGFSRMLDVSGGMYNSKLIDLRKYYENGLMVGGMVGDAEMLPKIQARIKTTDFDTDTARVKISWKSMPIEASSLLPNDLRLMVTPTGLVAPKADSPTKNVSADGVVSYEYQVDTTGDGICNTSGLTMTFTQATGIFKGAFNIYYDYMSAIDKTTYKDTYSQTIKSVSYEGVLTPERPDKSNGIEGRGFFLLPDQSSYPNAQDKKMLYNFNQSYDFQLMAP